MGMKCYLGPGADAEWLAVTKAREAEALAAAFTARAEASDAKAEATALASLDAAAVEYRKRWRLTRGR